MLKFISFVATIILVFSIFLVNSYGNNANEIISKYNPFEFEKSRIVPGSFFQVKIVDKKSFEESYKGEIEDIEKIELNYNVASEPVEIENYYFRSIDNVLILFVELPSWNKIASIKTQSSWGGWLTTYKAHIKISYKEVGNKIPTLNFPVEIPNVCWAYIWGIIAVVFSFLIVWVLKPNPLKKQEGFEADESEAKWRETNRVKRFFLYPLNFAVTPLGAYSISLTQIIFWTFITIFGIVYVYRLSGYILEITPQILILLGIGGGTALAAKINAQSKVYEIPSKYLGLIAKKTRIPKLKDLLTIDGQPNIYKFQMLIFTLFTGCYVIVEIVKKHSFPSIPDNLMIMMGISSMIYLGNEFTPKNEGDQIKNKIKAIEEYAQKEGKEINKPQQIKDLLNDEKISKEVEALINSLKNIYS